MSKNQKIKQTILRSIPYLLAFLILLPRLLSPQFGFFDDAVTLSQSQRFLDGDFNMAKDLQAGRFRPVYWLYYAIIYAFAGYHPFWYFLGNLVLLFILLIEIRQLIKRSGGVEWQVLLASCLFLFSMPIIENFYTLSKGEPLQLIFLLGAVLLLVSRPSDKPKIPWGKSLLAALFLLMAILIKETAIAMAPLAILWALYSVFSKDTRIKSSQKDYWALAGATVLAVLVYFGLRQIFHNTSLLGGTYTDRYLVDLGETLHKLLRWITQYAFYFHYTVPFILLWIWFAIKKVPLDTKQKFELFRWGAWWLLWFVIYIPWNYAEIYYLLPFAFGGALLISLTAPVFLKALKELQPADRLITVILGILTGLLFLLTLPNYRTDAKTQLAFDKANNEMLTYVKEIAPQDSTVLMNLQTTNEYFELTDLYLKEHFQRADVDLQLLDDTQMETISDQSGDIVLMPFIDNQPTLTVRAGVEETYQGIWNETFLSATDGQRQQLADYEETFRLSNINLPVVLCKFGLDAGFCQIPDPLFDFRTFVYGWEITKIQ